MRMTTTILMIFMAVATALAADKIGGWDTPKKEAPKEKPGWQEPKELKAAISKFQKKVETCHNELASLEKEIQRPIEKREKDEKNKLIILLEKEAAILIRQRKIEKAEECINFVKAHEQGTANWNAIPSETIQRKYDSLKKVLAPRKKTAEKRLEYKQKQICKEIEKAIKPVVSLFNKEIDKAAKEKNLGRAKEIEKRKNEFLDSNGIIVKSSKTHLTLALPKDAKPGDCLRTLVGHGSAIVSIAIAPDGKYALSGSKDKTIKYWDLSTGKCIRTLTGHTSYVCSVSISPDSRYALSGGG